MNFRYFGFRLAVTSLEKLYNILTTTGGRGRPLFVIWSYVQGAVAPAAVFVDFNLVKTERRKKYKELSRGFFDLRRFLILGMILVISVEAHAAH